MSDDDDDANGDDTDDDKAERRKDDERLCSLVEAEALPLAFLVEQREQERLALQQVKSKARCCVALPCGPRIPPRRFPVVDAPTLATW